MFYPISGNFYDETTVKARQDYDIFTTVGVFPYKPTIFKPSSPVKALKRFDVVDTLGMVMYNFLYSIYSGDHYGRRFLYHRKG